MQRGQRRANRNALSRDKCAKAVTLRREFPDNKSCRSRHRSKIVPRLRPGTIRMRPPSAVAFTCGALILAGVAAPAQATSDYEYKPDEYAIIDGGDAPNKQLALAAHGTEDLGYGFHVYLMIEPAHKIIATLPAIDDYSIL